MCVFESLRFDLKLRVCLGARLLQNGGRRSYSDEILSENDPQCKKDSQEIRCLVEGYPNDVFAMGGLSPFFFLSVNFCFQAFSIDGAAFLFFLALTLSISMLRGFRFADFEVFFYCPVVTQLYSLHRSQEYVMTFKGSWKSRIYTSGLVFSFFTVYHIYMLPIVDLLMLFGPKGDSLTVGGRHKHSGNSTWFLVRRKDAILFHVVHFAVVFFLFALMKHQEAVKFPRVAKFMDWLSKMTGLVNLGLILFSPFFIHFYTCSAGCVSNQNGSSPQQSALSASSSMPTYSFSLFSRPSFPFRAVSQRRDMCLHSSYSFSM